MDLAIGDTRAGEALELVDQALGLSRGPALVEFADLPFAQPEAVRLDELRLDGQERRAELLLSLGRAGQAAGDLDALLAEHPERERARGLLMEALYSQGRQTEALATYQIWRRQLADELGLVPSPALQGIEHQILEHTLPARTVASPAPPPRQRLALPVTSFVGRDADRSAVSELLHEARLLTLCGPAGVGKTRLALEVGAAIAERYPDGLYFCDLGVIRRPGEVIRTVAAKMGVEERAPRRLNDRLLDHLAGRQVLLLLDNCEHVLGAVATLAERMIEETATVDVVATSRERLAIDGEQLWTVPPLASGDVDAPAIQLFVDRARAVNRAFRPTAGALAVVAEICRQLDGLPLAIELAAARLHGMALEELAQSLDERFLLLTGGSRTNSRHRSLLAVLDWSLELLEPVVQSVFERLSAFAGRFDPDEAAVVAAGDGVDSSAVIQAVLRLVDCSLVVEHPSSGLAHYSLLDTMRSYGTRRLEANGSLGATRERHARWALALAEHASSELAGPHEGQWARALQEHLDDLRAAHSWLVGHDRESSLRLSVVLHPYAFWRAQSEVLRWAEVAAGAAAGTGSPLLSAVFASAATGAWQRGDLEGAGAAVQAARQAARGLDPQRQRPAQEARADVAILVGDLVEAETLFRAASELAVAAGDLLQAVWDLGSAGLVLAWRGQLDAAGAVASETFAIAERSGSPSARAFAHYVLGEISAATDPSAEDHLCRAVQLADAVNSTLVAGLARVGLATIKTRQHEPAAALGYYEDRHRRLAALERLDLPVGDPAHPR